jgi:hypothetical protein
MGTDGPKLAVQEFAPKIGLSDGSHRPYSGANPIMSRGYVPKLRHVQ